MVFDTIKMAKLNTGVDHGFSWTHRKNKGGFLTYEQHASESQGRVYLGKCTCCHTEKEVADQTYSLTKPQYNNTKPTNPSPDPITPGVWQGRH